MEGETMITCDTYDMDLDVVSVKHLRAWLYEVEEGSGPVGSIEAQCNRQKASGPRLTLEAVEGGGVRVLMRSALYSTDAVSGGVEVVEAAQVREGDYVRLQGVTEEWGGTWAVESRVARVQDNDPDRRIVVCDNDHEWAPDLRSGVTVFMLERAAVETDPRTVDLVLGVLEHAGVTPGQDVSRTDLARRITEDLAREGVGIAGQTDVDSLTPILQKVCGVEHRHAEMFAQGLVAAGVRGPRKAKAGPEGEAS